jgi:hypothetical protein
MDNVQDKELMAMLMYQVSEDGEIILPEEIKKVLNVIVGSFKLICPHLFTISFNSMTQIVLRCWEVLEDRVAGA